VAEDKAQENRLRRLATQRGFRLRRCGTADRSWDACFQLVDAGTDAQLAQPEYEGTLNQIESYLKRHTGSYPRVKKGGQSTPNNMEYPMPIGTKKAKMDAIAMLKTDHRRVEALFEAYEKARAERKARIAKEICQELSIHTTLEEEVFYPALQGKIDEEDMLDEAYVEHDGAKMLIAELMDGSPKDGFYDAKIKVLCEQIKHHVREEERRGDGIFVQAARADVDMEKLGNRMQTRKYQLLQEINTRGLPRPTTRAMRGSRVIKGAPVEAVE
jgi:hemerythrin superfamily protein